MILPVSKHNNTYYNYTNFYRAVIDTCRDIHFENVEMVFFGQIST